MSDRPPTDPARDTLRAAVDTLAHVEDEVLDTAWERDVAALRHRAQALLDRMASA